MNRTTISLAALTAIVLTGAAAAGAQNIRVGKGGYATTPPAGMKLPPRRIYRTDLFKGKTPTCDWWSSLAWEQYSSNHFAHPLAMRAVEGGLRISYPGPNINATDKHIMGGLKNELVLGHSRTGEFKDARLDAAGDWFVSVLMASGDRTMRLSYGHGSPFVYAMFAGGGAEIRFDGNVKIWAGDAKTPTLAVTLKGRHYGLFGPAGSTWSGLDGRKFVNSNGAKAYFSLAILPDARAETLKLFEKYAHNHVIDTKIAWRYRPSTSDVETTFTFKTKAYEGDATGALFALYPHQWTATKHKLLDRGYASVRGEMKLASGGSFTTVMRFPGVLPALPDKGGYATWFSGEPEHIHGIVMLPMQSGSLYLGLHPKYVQRNLQHLAKMRGGDKWKHWHDILWMYEALHDADKAMARFEADARIIPTHAKPHTYHWIGNLQALGQIDRTVTADCPTAVTFTRAGKRNHVAWNMTGRKVTVRFSDGVSMDVKPDQCATNP